MINLMLRTSNGFDTFALDIATNVNSQNILSI